MVAVMRSSTTASSVFHILYIYHIPFCTITYILDTLYFILAPDSNEEVVCSATSWRCRPVGIGANMVRSADTTAAHSAAPIAPIAPIAAHTCYLKVILLVLILPPCGHRSRHSEDTTGVCSGHLQVNLLVLILAPRAWGSEPTLRGA